MHLLLFLKNYDKSNVWQLYHLLCLNILMVNLN